ncbi:Site-specific DNA recombinase [Roseovarius lutimaris]|uniref:Site-specific DNA recombinase n=1 Tax=Roseovarius lutimaris TaxID=1005928 RepID=A0A1I5BRJ1_9RHOB|nr:recombinase family protein [Roseovarius lutimaris]SFN77248.1 Site-specific DNA recombinase [Roseovarius lutimaris]
MIETKQPKRVAIYARYSTDMQNPKSIDDQVRECRAHAEREGFSVVQVYSDMALSGAIKGRPGVEALQAAMRAQQFDIVLFEHLDRLSRDLEFLMGFYKEARHCDTEMHQLRRGKLGIFDIGILGTFAQIFLEELSLKTHRGLVGRIEAGKSAGGLSYGYKTQRDDAGNVIKGELVIDADEAAIVRRIFTEYAAGKSPQKIAADLNAEGVVAPRGRGAGSGHWKQNTIYGNRARGTGILNNELYIGRRIWNRSRYTKHPETGKRLSRPNPQDEWKLFEASDLRIVDEGLWTAVKARQEAIDLTRKTAEREGRSGAGAAQSTRRRKYLLSGLLTCGACGGNLTVAGKGHRRRYYCANAKEKGEAVCHGMPGLSETDAADAILSCLRSSLMQQEAYEQFRARFTEKMQAQEHDSGDALRRHDAQIKAKEATRANVLKAVENGEYSSGLIAHFNTLDAELDALKAGRPALVPVPIDLPDDLPGLYRSYVANLTATLTDEEVSGPAADELHSLLEGVVVSWNAGEAVHELELRGKLLEMLIKTKPAGKAGFIANARSLKLVAGVGFEPTTFRL